MQQQSIWTEPVFADLKLFAADGLSASQIASEIYEKHGIDVTRSAVIGKCFRASIALKRGGEARRSTMTAEERNRRRRDRYLRDRFKQQEKAAKHFEAIDAAPSVEDLAIAAAQRKRLFELEEHHCRWPVGEPSEPGFFFCGGDRHSEFPYCAGHCRVAFRRLV